MKNWKKGVLLVLVAVFFLPNVLAEDLILTVHAKAPGTEIPILTTPVADDQNRIEADHIESLSITKQNSQYVVEFVDNSIDPNSGLFCGGIKTAHNEKASMEALITNYGCFDTWLGIPHPVLVQNFSNPSLPHPYNSPVSGKKIEAHCTKDFYSGCPNNQEEDPTERCKINDDIWCMDFSGFFPDTECESRTSQHCLYLGTNKDATLVNQENFEKDNLEIQFFDNLPGKAVFGVSAGFFPAANAQIGLAGEIQSFEENQSILLDLGGEFCSRFSFSLNDPNIDYWCWDSQNHPEIFDEQSGFLYGCISSNPDNSNNQPTNCIAGVEENYCPAPLEEANTATPSATGSDGCCGDDKEIFPKGDIGFVSQNSQYLCAKDYNDGTDPVEYFLDSSAWSWWNAQEVADKKSYRIHSLPGSDFVSNNEAWFYCDPKNTNKYGQNSIDNFETFPQGSIDTGCICADFFNGEIPPVCGAEKKNCCEYNVGPSCDDNPKYRPKTYAECGVCYDGSGGVVNTTDSGSEILSSGSQKFIDTSSVLNPNFPTIKFNSKLDCEYNGQGKFCGQGTVCTTSDDYNFLIYNSADSDGSQDYCCVVLPDESRGITQYDSQEIITCQQQETASCAEQGKTLCPTQKQACLDGNIVPSSDEEVCCESENFCYDPDYYSETQYFKVNKSFVCYQEQNRGFFAECCNELTTCYNAQNQDNLATKDTYAFGVGTPLHSIASFEQIQGIFLKTRAVIVKEDLQNNIQGPSRSTVYGYSGDLRTNRKNNWQDFDNLEFSIYYSYPQNPVLNIEYYENNDNTNTGYNEKRISGIMQYSINGDNPGKWHRIRVSLSDLQQQGIKIANVYKVRITNVSGGTLMLDNFFLSINDPDKNNPLAQRYCSGYFKQWVDDFEPPSTVRDFSLDNIAEWGPYKDVCDYNFFGWTGTRCCGDDQSFDVNEVFEDSSGGCWNGDEVLSNERLADKTGKPGDEAIIFFAGKFHECGGSRTITGFDGSAENKEQIIQTVQEPIGTAMGDWACTIYKTWENDESLKQKTSRIFLASKLFNVSSPDFSLSCGKLSDISNTPTASQSFACILNNQPYTAESDFKSQKTFLGIIYDSKEDLQNSLAEFVPFSNTTKNPIPGIIAALNNCTTASAENFSKCPELKSGSKTLYTYHNSANKAVIIGFSPIDEWEDYTPFEQLWNSIAEFFSKLFNPTPVFYSEGVYLEKFSSIKLKPDYEKFFFERVNKKQILGIFEKLSGQNDHVMKIEYTNFQSFNPSPYVEKIRPMGGTNPAQLEKRSLFGCNKTIVYLKNTRFPKEYWDFFTKNIRISEQDTSASALPYNCNSFCGDGEINNNEQCDFSARLEDSCTALDPQNYNIFADSFAGGTAYCQDDCNYNITSCTYCGDGICSAGEFCEQDNCTCGNNIIEDGFGEQCDGNALPFQGSCSAYNSEYVSGALSCTKDCKLDFVNCQLPPPQQPIQPNSCEPDEGGPCTPGIIPCCEGLACVLTNSGNYRCVKDGVV